MKINEKSESNVKFGVSVFAIFFAIFVVFSPSLFAEQSTKSVDSQSPAKVSQYMQLINSVFGFVLQNYVDVVDPEVLYAGALKGLMDSLNDPYTTYLDTSSMRSLNDTTVGNFGGVGLSISKPNTSTLEKPAYVEVASPIEDGPGYKAGIHAGDLLISINGISTPDITMDEVLGMLRGTIGESVEVVVKRGKNMEFPVTLVRELIEVPTVKFGMIDNQKKKIGYLRIIEFTPQTAERVQQGIDLFKTNNFEGLIIDLRNNPGGLITSVADVANKFIDSGIIVSTKTRIEGESSVYTANPEDTTMTKGLPIVVLINKGSASASEILSGALKDNHLAYLVGERSYGKGSVQQVVPLYNNDGIKLTMARYYTPSDVNIDKIGIPPDREIIVNNLTEQEEKNYVDLINAGDIEKYVEAHPNMTEYDISVYARALTYSYKLNERLLRRLIRIEVQKTQTPSLYDLDFDEQLVESISIIENENFTELMKNTKTLKELQDAAVLADKKETEK